MNLILLSKKRMKRKRAALIRLNSKHMARRLALSMGHHRGFCLAIVRLQHYAIPAGSQADEALSNANARSLSLCLMTIGDVESLIGERERKLRGNPKTARQNVRECSSMTKFIDDLFGFV